MIRKITSDSSHFFHRIFKMQNWGWEGIFGEGKGIVILFYYITFLQVPVFIWFSLYYRYMTFYFAGGMSLELCVTLRGESTLFWSCPLICQTRRYWTDGWPSQSSVSWYPPICFWPIREGILCYPNLIRISSKNCLRYTNYSLYVLH